MQSDSLHTIGAFAVILDSQDRVLLSHRRDIDLWNLPGGRVEVGELPSTAAAREVKEETGLDVIIGRLIGVYGRDDGKADLVFSFKCKVMDGELTPTPEADRHDWFSDDDFPINTTPKHVARIRDALLKKRSPIYRIQSEPSGREWLRMLEKQGRSWQVDASVHR